MYPGDCGPEAYNNTAKFSNCPPAAKPAVRAGQFENPSPIPLKMPLRRFDTWGDGLSGAKAVLFGFSMGATTTAPTSAAATIAMTITMFFIGSCRVP